MKSIKRQTSIQFYFGFCMPVIISSLIFNIIKEPADWEWLENVFAILV